MKNFEFKSAVCTSVEQSKRLLELGLKKETADMMYRTYEKLSEEYRYYELVPEFYKPCIEGIVHIPAWSLHRIVEIMFKGDIEGFVGYNIHANSVNIMYEYAISNIEALIKMGSFNKDYLEDKK
jgi:hypothetical protein